MAPIRPGRVLNTREAAGELGVSERTLRRYIASGQIDFRRLPGGHYRIPRQAIADFWSEHSHAPRHAPARRVPLVPRPRASTAPTAIAGTSARRTRLSARRKPTAYEIRPAAGASEHSRPS